MNQNVVIVTLLFSIPIVAIVGGIVFGIVKMICRQRLLELVHRERIAAIEKGMEPTTMAPMPLMGDADDRYASPRGAALRLGQGLMIGGLVTLGVGVGVGLGLMCLLLPGGERAWPVGLIPAFVGIALVVSALVVRRGVDDEAPPSRI
jgi:hypothetical protein